MMYSLRVCILLAAFVALTLLTPHCVLACTCGPLTPQQAYQRSTAVFIGVVTDISGQPTAFSRGRTPLTVTLLVLHTLKGPRHPVVVVSTPRDSASCGYLFQLGGLYLVYAHGTPDAKATYEEITELSERITGGPDL